MGADAPEGVLGTSNYFFYYPETEANKAFVDNFKAAYDREPKVGALYGYITANFIAKAYEKAGCFDTEKFIDALEGMTMRARRASDHPCL